VVMCLEFRRERWLWAGFDHSNLRACETGSRSGAADGRLLVIMGCMDLAVEEDVKEEAYTSTLRLCLTGGVVQMLISNQITECTDLMR